MVSCAAAWAEAAAWRAAASESTACAVSLAVAEDVVAEVVTAVTTLVTAGSDLLEAHERTENTITKTSTTASTRPMTSIRRPESESSASRMPATPPRLGSGRRLRERGSRPAGGCWRRRTRGRSGAAI